MSIHKDFFESNLGFHELVRKIDLPFYYDKGIFNLYRFQATAYSYIYEAEHRNFSMYFDLGLKRKTRLLLSMFMELPIKSFFDQPEHGQYTSFLFREGLFALKDKESFRFRELSDAALHLAAFKNKFHKLYSIEPIAIPTNISTYNAI